MPARCLQTNVWRSRGSVCCTTSIIRRCWWHTHRSFLLQKDVWCPDKEVWCWHASTLRHGNGQDPHWYDRTAPDGAQNNLTLPFELHYTPPPYMYELQHPLQPNLRCWNWSQVQCTLRLLAKGCALCQQPTLVVPRWKCQLGTLLFKNKQDTHADPVYSWRVFFCSYKRMASDGICRTMEQYTPLCSTHTSHSSLKTKRVTTAFVVTSALPNFHRSNNFVASASALCTCWLDWIIKVYASSPSSQNNGHPCAQGSYQWAPIVVAGLVS